jgi:hypothetical protein
MVGLVPVLVIVGVPQFQTALGSAMASAAGLLPELIP